MPGFRAVASLRLRLREGLCEKLGSDESMPSVGATIVRESPPTIAVFAPPCTSSATQLQFYSCLALFQDERGRLPSRRWGELRSEGSGFGGECGDEFLGAFGGAFGGERSVVKRGDSWSVL